MGVIFVGGVYAVGKTVACEKASRVSKVAHFTASRLIKAEKANAIPDRGKLVADIVDNQKLLINGVNRALVESGGHLILDGHFTFPMADGRIECVDVEVFRALRTIGVVVYYDDPAAIAARFQERDGELCTSDMVAQHQSAELSHAHLVIGRLGIPLLLLSAFDSAGLVDAVERWSAK